jgi:hypothetical protein
MSDVGPGSSEARGRRWLVVLSSLLVLAAIPFDLAPWLRGPAPYPPEWQWTYRPDGASAPLLAAALCALGLLALLAATGAEAVRRRAARLAPLFVAAAVLLGWLFQVALLAREPGSPLATLLARTRSRSFTSYHAVAISAEARDPLAFLRRHAEGLPDEVRSAKHAATHPPGPVLFYRAALAVCEGSPRLTSALLAAAGVSDRDFPPPATRPARAAALLGALLLGLLGAATAWPVFRLAEVLGPDRLSAGRLGVLWALLPGPALMTPQFDQALALPVAAATLLALRALGSARPRRAAGLMALAGVAGGIALFTSYGAAAFLAIGGACALAAAGRWAGRRSWALAALGGAVTVLVAFGVPALLGHEPFRALATALRIHREVYTAPRSYPLWLLFDPLDLALFLGVPVAVAGVLRLLPSASSTRLGPVGRFRRAAFGGVAVLVLLGVTRGEVGRLWIPLMPLLLVASLGGEGRAPGTREALLQGVLLAALTLAIGRYWVI